MPVSKLTEERIERAVFGLRAGLPRAWVARYVGVAPRTFRRWLTHARDRTGRGPYRELREAMLLARSRWAEAPNGGGFAGRMGDPFDGLDDEADVSTVEAPSLDWSLLTEQETETLLVLLAKAQGAEPDAGATA